MTQLFVIVAIRGLLELVLWLIIGRIVLVVLAGRHGADNPVIRMFDFLLRPVRACSRCLMPGWSISRQDAVFFILLLLLWCLLGVVKLMTNTG